MNKYSLFLTLICVVLSPQAVASEFNLDGIKNKRIAESCYHDPCTSARFMNYKVLDKGRHHIMLKTKVVWGYRYWKQNKITWNHHFSNLFVTCSKMEPSIQIGSDIVNFNFSHEYGVPGVEYPYAIAYFTACHNSNSPQIGKLAKRFGYSNSN